MCVQLSVGVNRMLSGLVFFLQVFGFSCDADWLLIKLIKQLFSDPCVRVCVQLV